MHFFLRHAGIFFLGAFIAAPALAGLDPAAETQTAQEPAAKPTADARTLAGDYLSSLFAQRHHDWRAAGQYLDDVMKKAPSDPALARRAMVLAMGSGDVETAIRLAKESGPADPKDKDALTPLFLAVGALHDKQYDRAVTYVESMPEGSLSTFILPLLRSWAMAGVGTADIQNLGTNTIHIHHAALIADLLKQPERVMPMLDKLATDTKQLTAEDFERLANLYLHLDRNDKAVQMYRNIGALWAEYEQLAAERIAVIEDGKAGDSIIPVTSAEQGMAAALYDMANLLYREYADDSARVFGNLALYLSPGMTDAHLLLAAIATRNNRPEDALAHYSAIGRDNKFYVETRHRIAEIQEQGGDIDGALTTLRSALQAGSKDDNLESEIRIGDIYRRQENYPRAIEAYNQVAQKLGAVIPADYWHLLYVRGMSYERAGDWPQAERDLKAALEYQPDHPHILNYLAYAWADKGVHLDQALDYLRKAVAVQPQDGYIVDSLGWVLFRMGKYPEALMHLEKAAELMPYDPVINDHLGDALWRAGRTREARFQWQRARNFSKEPTEIAMLEQKIADGLSDAHSGAKPEVAQAAPAPAATANSAAPAPADAPVRGM